MDARTGVPGETMTGQAEMIKRYRDAWFAVWGYVTALSQIVTEDFPDPEAGPVVPTRYQIDTLNGLAGSLSALIEGHERK